MTTPATLTETEKVEPWATDWAGGLMDMTTLPGVGVGEAPPEGVGVRVGVMVGEEVGVSVGQTPGQGVGVGGMTTWTAPLAVTATVMEEASGWRRMTELRRREARPVSRGRKVRWARTPAPSTPGRAAPRETQLTRTLAARSWGGAHWTSRPEAARKPASAEETNWRRAGSKSSVNS